MFKIQQLHQEITFDTRRLSLPQGHLLDLLSIKSDQFIFIKDSQTRYHYVNLNFAELMGFASDRSILGKTDQMLCRDKQKTKAYKELDEIIFDTAKVLEVSEIVKPIANQRITKQMAGQLYPVFYNDKVQPTFVLGIVGAVRTSLKLSLESALSLTTLELGNLLTRRSYPVTTKHYACTISKRELQCLIETLKGKHAGEVGESLNLKQTTVETYLDNLKNKFGAINKSSLINSILKEKVIQQIVL